jgi:signal transduction histidine kinase
MDETNEDKLRTDVREDLARELHDSVAGQLQTMLVEMELMRRRGAAPSEIETFQATTRQALGSLREMLYQLRDRPTGPGGVDEQIERRVNAALTPPRGRKRRPGAGPANA